MKQKLIAVRSLESFRQVVNEHLEEGWTVVPGTMQLATSVARSEHSWNECEAYGIVLQCETDS